MEIKFYDPKTESVSLTGAVCKLQCDHCRGHYLKAMLKPSEALCITDRSLSFLISGGFDKLGRIPLWENKDLLWQLKTKSPYPLNVHPGFLEKREINLLKELGAVVSFDFTQDEKVINEIYHLPLSPEDYLEQFIQLKESGVKVVPHILLGLGQREKDEKTLEVLAQLNPEKVVILVFRKTSGTPLKEKDSLTLKELESLWLGFRSLYSNELILGCMRPGGSLRSSIDALALESGFQGIVKPTKDIKKRYKNAILSELCCALE